MNHVQSRMNFDGTLCFDVYADDIAQYADGFAELIKAYDKKTGGKLRRHPFRYAHCSECGHPILTNRDKGEVFECKNCSKKATLETEDSPWAQELALKFNKAVGMDIKKARGEMAAMLVLLPDSAGGGAEEQVVDILEGYGFSVQDLDGPLFGMMEREAHARGWDRGHSRRLYAEAKLSEGEVTCNGDVPFVEECDRRIRKSLEDVYTLSAEAPRLNR